MSMLRKSAAAFFKKEDGNVSIIVAGGMVALLMVVSIVADVGLLFARQQKLQNALDAGALAGIQSIFAGEQAAEDAARSYTELNEGTTSAIEADSAKLSVRVTGEETVPLWFAKVMGYEAATVHATANATAHTVTGMTGLVPIAVPDQSFSYGKLYKLTEGAGDGYSGNYGFVDFSGGGASGLADNIRYGYDGMFRVGDKVPTKTGINHGPVESALNDRIDRDEGNAMCQSYTTATRACERVVFLPVIDTLDVNGQKPVTIVGFAAFFLEGISDKGGHMTIEGRFLRMVTPGEMGSGPNYGVYSVKLSR